MRMYNGKALTRTVDIDGKSISVDSALEERVIRQLQQTGYASMWRRTEHGLSVGPYNYTPDLELSLLFEGMIHRALIEIKPAKRYFNADISRRMRGVAPYYLTKLLLLYADQEKQWYRIDIKTGRLSAIKLPPPGGTPIEKLYKPWSLPGKRIYNHSYTKRFNPLFLLLRVIAEILEAVLSPPQKKPYKTRRITRR
jgi:hypothetical protein